MEEIQVRRATIIFSAIGALFMLICFIARVRLGSVSGGWAYPYFRVFSFKLLGPFLASATLVLGMLWASRHQFERHPRFIVIGWLGVGILAQLILRWHAPATLDALIHSDIANSFYSPTLRFRALEFLTSFPAIRETLPLHAATNMPGKVMLFYLLEMFTSSPLAMGVLIIALSNVGGVFLYIAVQDLFGDRRIALYSLILYLFVPGKLYFAPLLNIVSPTLILLCLALFTRYLSTRSAPWAVGLGASAYLLAFFEPLPLTMGLFFVVFLATGWWKGELSWRETAALGAFGGAGFAIAYGAMWLLFGYDLIESFLYALDHARGFNERAQRPYQIWVIHNLYDFVVAVGGSLIALVPLALALVLRSSGLWRDRLSSPVVLWTIGLFAVLAFLDLAGINRGEVTRLWLFLASCVPVVAAYLCAQTESSLPFAFVIACLLLETSVGIGMGAFALA